MKSSIGRIALLTVFGTLAVASVGTAFAAPSDLDVTMDVIDTTDDVAGAKEIDVGEKQEAAIAGKDTIADVDNVQQEVQSGVQESGGG